MGFSWRLSTWLSCLTVLHTQARAQSIPPPALDLKGLGQVVVGGSFDSIQLYSYAGQSQGLQSNGSRHSVFRQSTSGIYEVIATTDAHIEDMCTFVLKNGTVAGMAIGGNFTSITPYGGTSISAPSVAYIDARTGKISPHAGIQGPVTSLLCDMDTETIYVGGAFDASYSSNAIAWLATGSWSNLAFRGFDGPVTSLTKGPNGTIVFGGSFSGLKNMTATDTTSTQTMPQILNLDAATITSVANTTSGAGIVCPSNNSANAWLLQDNTPGSWTATLRYGFEPSKLRLYNTNIDGRGTKTFRLTALPNTGIMNLTYTDPITGRLSACDATCPLVQNASVPYQDFYFVNRVGMNSFRLDVSAWYGKGGALAGVELYQNDTFVYAIASTNRPSCLAASNTLSNVTATGPWTETPSGQSYANYLSAVVNPSTAGTDQVVFYPDIGGSGNYTIVMFTPGCMNDGTCANRGMINITGTLTANGGTFTTQIAQTNYFEKYDNIYQGKIDGTSSSFRPSVTIRALGQQPNQVVVASRVRFAGNPSTGGLNGLYQFDPNLAVADTDFSKSAINNAGTRLKPGAQMLAFSYHDGVIYTGGRFSDDTLNNIMLFADNKAQSLPNSGLNAPVANLYANNDMLYVGGEFSGTQTGNIAGLNNVAGYSYGNKSWVALGAGLNGPVYKVTPLPLNITGASQIMIAFSGAFTQIRASSYGPAHSVDGLAIWVPSSNNWYQNVPGQKANLAGMLSANATWPNGTWYGGGTLTYLGQGISGAARLAPAGSNSINLEQMPVEISASPSSSSGGVSKRALLPGQNVTGVVTGAFERNNGRNVTILGGRFSAQTSAGGTAQNLVLIDGGHNNNVTGLPPGLDNDGTFLTLAVQNDLLLAGGRITGQVNGNSVRGIVIYDFGTTSFRSPQPAALQGSNVIANSIVQRQGTSHMYVGGSFDTTAQGLACPSVCMYDTSAATWNTVGSGLSGTVTFLYFVDDKNLLAAGDLQVAGNAASLAQYNIDRQSWSTYGGTNLPGPVTAFVSMKGSNTFWAAGTASNGSTYLTQVQQRNNQLTLAPLTNGLEADSVIQSLDVLNLQNGQSHGNSRYLDGNQDLLVTGRLNLTGYGAASAALYNGTTFTPFLLSTSLGGSAGSINSVFYSQSNPALAGSPFRHSNGIAILVAFCAALGTIFLIILLGMLINRIQRRRAGYIPVPSVPYQDKNMNINRIPPQSLFGTVGNKHGGPPVI